MKKALKLLLWVAVLAAVWFAIKSWWLAPEALEIEAVLVRRGRVEATVTNSKAGTVKARLRARIAPEVGGRVVEIRYREGQRVEAGAELFRLNDAVQQARLSLAQAALASARAGSERTCVNAEQALRELERNRRLAADHVVSTEIVDRLESEHKAALAACREAEAEVARATAAVEQARAQLELTVVRAPFGGVVAELSAEVGEWITPSPPLLPVPSAVDLLDPSSLYVSAPMDEVDAGALRAGLPVKITVDSHPGQVFPGRLSRVAAYVLDVEQQNRTVEIEAEFDDHAAAEALLPGTSADVEVILETREDALRIPAAALFEGEKVLLVESGRLAAREVRLGLRNWDWCEVLEGLSEGDRIVALLDRKEIQPGAEVVLRESP